MYKNIPITFKPGYNMQWIIGAKVSDIPCIIKAIPEVMPNAPHVLEWFFEYQTDPAWIPVITTLIFKLGSDEEAYIRHFLTRCLLRRQRDPAWISAANQLISHCKSDDRTEWLRDLLTLIRWQTDSAWIPYAERLITNFQNDSMPGNIWCILMHLVKYQTGDEWVYFAERIVDAGTPENIRPPGHFHPLIRLLRRYGNDPVWGNFSQQMRSQPNRPNDKIVLN